MVLTNTTSQQAGHFLLVKDHATKNTKLEAYLKKKPIRITFQFILQQIEVDYDGDATGE